MDRLFFGILFTILLIGCFFTITAWGAEIREVDKRIQSTFDTVERVLGTLPDSPSKSALVPSITMKPVHSGETEGEQVSSHEEGPIASSSGTTRYFGLIIGIDRYRKLPKLENAVNDAVAIDLILREQYGFKNLVLLDGQASRDNIMRVLNDLRRQLTEYDSLLIYYSGHGEYNAQTETSYWLPVDADRDDTTQWIESRSIADQLKLLSSMHVLVVADSCFSGTITRSAGTELSGRSSRLNYLKKIGEKTSRVLIASGGNEPVIDSGGKGHSVFAEAFIAALSQPFDKVFTAEELMARQLKELVAGKAEQLPEYKVIRNSGHDGGDFVFVQKR